MKRLFYVVVVIVTLLLGVTFAVRNRQEIDIAYYFGLEWRGSLSIVQARKEVRQIEQEVMNLRALPIKDVI